MTGRGLRVYQPRGDGTKARRGSKQIIVVIVPKSKYHPPNLLLPEHTYREEGRGGPNIIGVYEMHAATYVEAIQGL